MAESEENKAEETAAAPPAAAPAFGSATFGSAGFGGFGGGFASGGFGAAAPVFGAPAAGGTTTGGGEAEDDGAPQGEDQECTATFKPVVELEEVATSTGEEEEEAMWEGKAKLYRYITETNEWKERGTGVAKLLKHKEHGKIRMLMRRNKTLKICANFYAVPGINLKEHNNSDKTWVFSCMDASEDEPKMEMFAMRFPSVEDAQAYKKTFEEATEAMGEIMEKEGIVSAESGAADGEEDKEAGKEGDADKLAEGLAATTLEKAEGEDTKTE